MFAGLFLNIVTNKVPVAPTVRVQPLKKISEETELLVILTSSGFVLITRNKQQDVFHADLDSSNQILAVTLKYGFI